MTRLHVAHYGTDRLRVGRWQGDRRCAYLAPVAGGPTPSTDGVRRCLDDLRDRGFSAFVTSALTVAERAPFLDLGFDVHERLELLGRDLARLPGNDPPDPRPRSWAGPRREAESPARIRRARRRDRPSVLTVDHLAFDPFWRLDNDGLRDALTATPARSFRVAVDRGVVGYVITGRSSDRGYLQRLAVHPRVQGRGVGTALVLEGLRWVRRRGASSVLVNTQQTNRTALALYERLGFRRQPEGLAVLEWPTGAVTP